MLQVLEVLRSPLPDHFLMFQLRERPVKLQVHMLSDNSIFVNSAMLGHLFNLSLEDLVSAFDHFFVCHHIVVKTGLNDVFRNHTADFCAFIEER